jgi:hypothetical protein
MVDTVMEPVTVFKQDHQCLYTLTNTSIPPAKCFAIKELRQYTSHQHLEDLELRTSSMHGDCYWCNETNPNDAIHDQTLLVRVRRRRASCVAPDSDLIIRLLGSLSCNTQLC